MHKRKQKSKNKKRKLDFNPYIPSKNSTKNKKNPKNYISIFVWTILIFFLISAIAGEYRDTATAKKPLISEVVSEIREEKIKKIVVRGDDVEILYKDDTRGLLKKDRGATFDETIFNLGVSTDEFNKLDYSNEKEKGVSFWFKSILPFLFPLILIILFIWYFRSQTKGLGTSIFSFGKSKARIIFPKDDENKVTFEDVAGSQEAKEELMEFVDFLKSPAKFLKIGAKVPKGVLLTGPPGTGKTLLARAVAGEAGVPFLSISGSEFVEMFVGVGASRVRDLFDVAKKNSPSIIFIDEIDAVGRSRGSGMGGGNDEREQALNQILVEMDGFEQNSKIVVLASTNRPDILDQALLRPGRFDRKILVGLPDIKEREKILETHMRGKNAEKDVNLEVVARRTPGLSGADLYSIVNEAAIFAVRESRAKIKQRDLLNSIEKVLFGPERKAAVITSHERKVIAYHEAGHALLASLLPFADPVQKITIVSRGQAGGYVLSMPDQERRLKTSKEFLDTITTSLGGYVAEKEIFGDVSTGPQNDLERVTELATQMVTRFGMSDKFGPVVFKKSNNPYLSDSQIGSNEKAKMIDEEVSSIVTTCLKNAQKLLRDHRKALDIIVEELFKKETLEREEFETILSENGVVVKNNLDY